LKENVWRVTNDGDVEGGYCIEEKLQGVLTLDIKICTQNKEFTLLTVFVSLVQLFLASMALK